MRPHRCARVGLARLYSQITLAAGPWCSPDGALPCFHRSLARRRRLDLCDPRYRSARTPPGALSRRYGGGRGVLPIPVHRLLLPFPAGLRRFAARLNERSVRRTVDRSTGIPSDALASPPRPRRSRARQLRGLAGGGSSSKPRNCKLPRAARATPHNPAGGLARIV